MLLRNGIIGCHHHSCVSFQTSKSCLLFMKHLIIPKKLYLEKTSSTSTLHFLLKYRSISTVTEALSVLQISSDDRNENEQHHQSSQRIESNHKNNIDFNTIFPISQKQRQRQQHIPLHEKIQANTVHVNSYSNVLPVPPVPPATLSRKEIRLAYLQAAKESHPDSGVTTTTTTRNNEEAIRIMNEKFNKVTQAYEYLIQYYCTNADGTNKNTTKDNDNDNDNNWGITMEEEIDFNESCLATLGLSAEIVEESKQDPGFRQWLMGNTQWAYIWRNFLACHGGLAPKLRPRLLLEPSTDYKQSTSNKRILRRLRRR